MQWTVNCGKVGHAAFPFGPDPVVATETRRFDTSSTWQEPAGAGLSGRHQAPGSLRMPRGASGILEGNRSLAPTEIPFSGFHQCNIATLRSTLATISIRQGHVDYSQKKSANGTQIIKDNCGSYLWSRERSDLFSNFATGCIVPSASVTSNSVVESREREEASSRKATNPQSRVIQSSCPRTRCPIIRHPFCDPSTVKGL